MYNKNIHNRKSIRLKNYDYTQNGYYFITICTQDRINLFGKILDGIMILNSAGKIVEREWLQTVKIRSNIQFFYKECPS